MKKILIITGTYLPGVKGGGPIQSVKNLIENLADKFEFYILTSDRDLGDEVSYENIVANKWGDIGPAKIMYIDKKNISLKKMKNIINDLKPDTLYLNSFFSYKFSIIPLILKRFKYIEIKNILLAPRGEFSPGALSLKKLKKRIYIWIFNLLKLYKDINWHATAETEKKDIENNIKKTEKISVISNFTQDISQIHYSKELTKEVGSVKLIYISRIHPKKNLEFSLKILKKVKGNIIFNIYGPIEDEDYWKRCLEIIENLPENIKVNYLGLIANMNVIDKIKENHFFFFLTQGENFGHVIAEALISGTPVIISNQTPWRDLQSQNIGWDLELDSEEYILKVLQYIVDIDNYNYNIMSKKAFEYSKKVLDLTEKKIMMEKIMNGNEHE